MSFDDYRALYDRLTEEEILALYAHWGGGPPGQRHCDLEALIEFLTAATRRGPTAVMEIGGHDGHSAHVTLEVCPRIVHWLNVEIDRRAAFSRAERSDRYSIEIPRRYRWWRDASTPRAMMPIVVAVHVFEHLSESDVWELTSSLRPLAWYVEASLGTGGQSRGAHHGPHVLRIGWRQLGERFRDVGYEPYQVRDTCWAFIDPLLQEGSA